MGRFRSAGYFVRRVCDARAHRRNGGSDPAGNPHSRLPANIAAAPDFHTAGWQAAEAQLALEQRVAEFASRMARRCSLVSSARLAEDSPAAGRYDLKADLLTGLPYTLPHAAAVASAMARLLAPPAPGKVSLRTWTIRYGADWRAKSVRKA